MPGTSSDKVHFFISYTSVDKGWAEWIAWQLEQAGQRTLIQAWDFKSGGVFPGDMHRALHQSLRVIAVLSPAYMASSFCQPEWQAAFADDPTGAKGVLVCVRVADFEPDGLLRGRTYIDLVDLTEDNARTRLLEQLEQKRSIPASAPVYPPTISAESPIIAPPPSPAFPGTAARARLSPTSTLSIPHNLPALQPFFGREEELEQIAVALDAESRTWGALIDGPGGMGKTSLAVRAAYAVPPDAFDRIVFISLKSRELDDDGVRDLSGFVLSGLTELLSELARQLGRDDILKQADDQRPRLLLDALRSTRALLILDNLESLLKTERDTVFTFVKRIPTGCKAILTSRGRIGSGAEELILGKLSEEAAMQTLAELATHNAQLRQTSESERLVLYRETGGSPLLLRWAAGQIGRGHCLTFTDAIAYLRSCPPGNDALEFVFGDLVADFSAAETQALCALTYFTLPATVEHITAVVKPLPDHEEKAIAREAFYRALNKAMPVNTKNAANGQNFSEIDIDRALRSLANRSLVIPSTEMKTFTLVPLVADFLRKTKPEIIAATGNRLEQRALALILENGYENHDRFPKLEAAWPGVAPALPLFLAGPNDRLQEVCRALDVYLNFTGRWDEWLALSQQAEMRAVAAEDLDSAGWRTYKAGWVHYLRGQAQAVLVCADRAEEYWRQAFPPGSPSQAGIRECAAAIRLRGIGHNLNRDYPSAIAAYRQTVGLLRSIATESAEIAASINDLAEAEHQSGDLGAAEMNLREALRIARAIDYTEGVAFLTGNLASIALNRTNYAEAEIMAREALVLSEKIGRLELIARDHLRLSQALNKMGRYEEAQPHFRQAQVMLEFLGVAAYKDFTQPFPQVIAKKASCLYVESIELIDIRCFESLKIPFVDLENVSLSNVVLGDNAAGKSTLLRCLAIGLCNEPDATALLASLPGDFIKSGANEGIIKIELRRRDSLDSYSIITKLSKIEGADRLVESIEKTTVPEEDFPWKDIFVCGYGTSRVATGSASHESYSQRLAVATLFDERAQLWNPEVALLRRPFDLRKKMEQRLLCVLMLDSPEDSVVFGQGPTSVRGPWGTCSFEVLSDGYRSTSQWLLDFMAWAILANRFGELDKFDGILLIDEIEQHLHPRWQRHILQRLSRQLPGTQIIATTHTPLIVGGIVDVETSTIIRLGEGGEVEKLNKEHLRGKRADQILTSAFGLPTSRSIGNTDDVDRYAELYAKHRNTDEEIEFQKLSSQLEKDLKFGESEYEQDVEEAIAKTLQERLGQAPTRPLSMELKQQLRELFQNHDQN